MPSVDVNFNGSLFTLKYDEAVDAAAVQVHSGSFEPPLPLLISVILNHFGGTFLDVGANSGVYCLVAASIAKCKRIIAFEPLPHAYETLKRNIEDNGLTARVDLRQVGLSDRTGTAKLSIPDPGHGLIQTSATLGAPFYAVHSSLDIAISRLDDIALPPDITVIKVDIEGHEPAFLRGAKDMIDKNRPIIFGEVLSIANFAELSAFLSEVGYVDFRLRPDMVLHDASVVFDNEAWNHAWVPREQVRFFIWACEAFKIPVYLRHDVEAWRSPSFRMPPRFRRWVDTVRRRLARPAARPGR